MEIRWSIPAAEDLERICTWIERDRPEAAKRVAATIYNGIAQLRIAPGLGRVSSRMNGCASWCLRRCPILPFIELGKK